ncbi:HAD family hydrolase, partial [Candidatus Bathyarchaeota archaeon]
VLEELSKKYVLILTSNSAREFLEFLVGKFEKFFSHTFSATSDFKCVKKDKEFYLKICKILDKKPEEISHVGDRWEDDFLIPREIGIKAFYLDRSGKRRDKFTVKDLKEFMDKLEGGLHV